LPYKKDMNALIHIFLIFDFFDPVIDPANIFYMKASFIQDP